MYIYVYVDNGIIMELLIRYAVFVNNINNNHNYYCD